MRKKSESYQPWPVEFSVFLRSVKDLMRSPAPPRLQKPENSRALTAEEERAMHEKMMLFRSND